MAALPHEMQSLFERIETLPKLQEEKVAQAVYEFSERDRPHPKHIEEATFAERFVFTLCIDIHGERGCWGSYFRPMFMTYEAGGGMTSHAIESLSPETVPYWTARATEATHPILRARYADAAWELASLVKGVKREISNVRIAIDAYIAVASASAEVYPTISSLRRALSLAISIHDRQSVQRVVDEMFSLAVRAANTAQLGTSLTLFDSLFDLRKKIQLSDERMRQLIDGLEACLRSAAGQDAIMKVDHFAAQRYAERLLRFFRSVGTQQDVVRVTRLMCGAIETAAETCEPSVAAAWLHEAQIAYGQAVMKDDADRVLLKIKEKGREAKGRMISHVFTQQIPVSDVEDFLDRITSGGLDACFSRIVTTFLPQSGKLRERLAEIKNKYPMTALFPIALISDDQVVARVGSIDGDEEGRLLNEMAQDMQFWPLFLMESLERLFVEYDILAEHFVDLLYRTPLWGIERYQILKNGLRHYRDGDYIAAVHVLVPQIEHALRELLAAIPRPTNLHNSKLDAYQEKDLGAILADGAMAKLLGEDIGRYLRSLLTDQRGWNLRNRLSHGLYHSHFFQRQIADRVVHVLMVISCFRPSNQDG